MASTRRHTACRRTAEFASRTCCLPFYVHFQNGGSNAAHSAGLRPSASRFVPKLVDSAKTAEPKMAFNFAHLLSAACGGAPHRLRRLRRPWRRAVVRAPLAVVFVAGARLVKSLDLYRISTLVAKLRNRKWRLILRTCCPPPAAALRAAWGACGAPLRAGGSSVYGCRCARYTTGALWRAPSTTTQSWLPHAREWLLYLRKHWASLVPHP